MLVINMSAAMATQGGQVMGGQSNTCHALDMGKMTKYGSWRAAISEPQQLNTNPSTNVLTQIIGAVMFPVEIDIQYARE